MLLTVRDLTMRFGGITALSDVSFDVGEGKIVGLIGPNGAGKTTCFNCITRFYEPTEGEIRFKGQSLLACAPFRITGRRIARTFQNLELFGTMTVLEHVLIGAHARFGGDYGEREAEREALEILDYLKLAPQAGAPVRSLPFGARKMVELARALAAKPELLLLDEPAAGLGHDEVARLGETIDRIRRDFATTLLMVEHHMALVMGISDHIVVLDSGRKLAEGEPTAIRGNSAVIDAYLGTG